MSKYTDHERFADATDDYLDTHDVYSLFSKLLKQLAINQPADPYSFLITQLEKPQDTKQIVVVGPPGVGKSTQVAKIVATYGVVHLKVDALLKDEVDQKTPTGEKIKQYNENQVAVPDDVITGVLQTRLDKQDCVDNGWLLDGYPSTASQATSMQSAGILCDIFVVMTCDPATAKQRGEQSGTYAKLQDYFSDLTTNYSRHIRKIAPLFSKTITYIDTENSVSEVWMSMKTALDKTSPSQAPRRPMRVLVLGPVGAGKEMQCTRLASKFQLVHLSVGRLLRAEMTKSPEFAETIQPYFNNGTLVPDEIVTPIVINRILQSDCKKKGWLLDGFPRTVSQADALAAAGINPNRCVAIEVPDDVALQRCWTRRFDPLTGAMYKDTANASQQVRNRLVTRPEDESTCVKTKLMEYSAQKDALFEMYKNVLGTFDGDQNEDWLSDQVENFIVASLGAYNANRS